MIKNPYLTKDCGHPGVYKFPGHETSMGWCQLCRAVMTDDLDWYLECRLAGGPKAKKPAKKKTK